MNSFDNDRPIYIQLVEKIIKSIICGEYSLGSKLPSVRELAIIYKVNPNTVQKALSEIEDTGLIYTERTNGKYVTNNEKLIKKTKDKLASEITSKYIDDMNKLGIAFNEISDYLKEGK